MSTNNIYVQEVVLGKLAFRNNANGTYATREFVVRCEIEDSSTLYNDIAGALPQKGAVHPYCTTTYVKEIIIKMRTEDNSTFDATVTYDPFSESLSVSGGMDPEIPESPIDTNVYVNSSSGDVGSEVVRHAYGSLTPGTWDSFFDAEGSFTGAVNVSAKKVPVLNSAGDLFRDPPTTPIPVVEITLVTQKYATEINTSSLYKLLHTVNNSWTTIDSFFIDTYCGLITGVSVSRVHSDWSDPIIKEVQVTISYRASSWMALIADRGYREIDPVTEKLRDILIDSEKSTEPVQLWGNGITTASSFEIPNPLNEVWQCYLLFNPKSWSYLGDIFGDYAIVTSEEDPEEV